MALTQYQRDSTAFLSLSQTQRRLAHRAKTEAMKWLSDGNTFNYHNLRQESDRLWRDAKYHLAWAKRLAR